MSLAFCMYNALNVCRECSVAHTMIRTHPYNTWPLKVTAFTREADKVWSALSASHPMPPGFQYNVELEGVDGKSGHAGAGRTGPIDVTDCMLFNSLHYMFDLSHDLSHAVAEFTASHIQKAQRVANSSSQLVCAVCKGPVHNLQVVSSLYHSPSSLPNDKSAQSPLDTGLCPTPNCNAVYHLTCLASSFSAALPSTSTNANLPPLIPRGGTCTSCNTYVLWGDMIKGCYRLYKGQDGTIAVLDEELTEEDEEDEDASMADEDDMDVDEESVSEEVESLPTKRKGKKSTKSATAQTTKPKAKTTRKKRARISKEVSGFLPLP